MAKVTLQELKKRLAEAEARRDKLGGAIKRFRRFSGWAKKVGLQKLAASMAERADAYQKEREAVRKRISDLRNRIKNFDPGVPPYNNGWYPPAKDNHYSSSGAFTVGKKKVVLHTTEGFSLPAYSGSNPHFTIDPKSGTVWQHVSIEQASSALLNVAGGVETNHAGAIQIEMIGFAKDTPGWSDAAYANVKELVDWIRKWAHIGPVHPAFLASTTPNHMSESEWIAFNGVCGHRHVPENTHYDPGAFKVEKIL